MNSDIKFKKNILDKFLEAAKKIDDFIIFLHKHEKGKYLKEYFSPKRK